MAEELVSRETALEWAEYECDLTEAGKTILSLYDQLEAKPSDALREENERLRAFAESVPGPRRSEGHFYCPTCHKEANFEDAECQRDCLYVRAQAALDARGAETTEER